MNYFLIVSNNVKFIENVFYNEFSLLLNQHYKGKHEYAFDNKVVIVFYDCSEYELERELVSFYRYTRKLVSNKNILIYTDDNHVNIVRKCLIMSTSVDASTQTQN